MIRFFRIENSAASSSHQIHNQMSGQMLSQFLQTQSIDTGLIQFGGVYINGKRLLHDKELCIGDLLRCHLKPKRYRLIGTQFWSPHILFDHLDFIVINKPAGLPTHATLDNAVENCKYILEQTIGQPLFVTHRLDIATQGVLIFAKSKLACKMINLEFSSRRTKKIYAADVVGLPKLGKHIHYMQPSLRAPKVLSKNPVEGWHECQMQILSAEPHPEQSGVYRLQVELLTGRTHQIRAQLSALGHPIMGEDLYVNLAGQKSISTQALPLALQCQFIELNYKNQIYKLSLHGIKSVSA